LDLSVFRVRGFSMPSFSMLLFFISSFMVSLVGPFYFEGVMAFSPSQVGIIYMITPVIMMIASPISGSLFDKHHWRYHASVGVMVVAAALALLGFMALAGILALMAAAYALQGFGGSLFQIPNNTELMGALPPPQRGVASSVSATFRNLGMSLASRSPAYWWRSSSGPPATTAQYSRPTGSCSPASSATSYSWRQRSAWRQLPSPS
jgi:MFS family permease